MLNSLQAAQAAALAGGEILKSHHGNPGMVRSKGTPTDFVSETDVAAGVAIVRSLLSSDPSARVVVEEPEVCELLGIEPGAIDDEEVWVIDPLDGTTSFLHGFPAYSVSVALLRAGQPVAGAVYNVPLDELFSADAGGGATHNGSSIHCSPTAHLTDALVVTGFPYDRGKPLDRQLVILGTFLRAPVHGVRRDGTAALDCCHVASARADGFWEFTLKPWDMAAGVIIAREAGARVTDCAGAEWTAASESICVANPELHADMLRIITSTPG